MDTMSMPVWERRNYIEQFLEEVEYQNKQIEEQSKKSKRG